MRTRVCLSVSTCVHALIFLSMFANVYVCTTYARSCVRTSVYVFVFRYLYVHAPMGLCLSVRVPVCACVHMCSVVILCALLWEMCTCTYVCVTNV